MVWQDAFVALLGQVVIQLHSSRRENQSSLIALLDCLTLVMAPIAYLEGLIELLKNPDNDIRRKVSREANSVSPLKRYISVCCPIR